MKQVHILAIVADFADFQCNNNVFMKSICMYGVLEKTSRGKNSYFDNYLRILLFFGKIYAKRSHT